MEESTTMNYKAKLLFLVILSSSILECFALKYDPAQIYSYSYKTGVQLNEVNSKKTTKVQQDVGIELSISFDLSTVYKDDNSQIFKLSVTKAEILNLNTQGTKKQLKSFLPVLFQINGDLVENLYFADKDTTFSRNIIKGIVAIFQVQETSGQRKEVDVSGECEVSYTTNKPDEIVRTKTDCKNLEIAREHSNTNQALGTSLYIKSSHTYKLKDSIIQSVSGNQQVITYLNIRPALNGVAGSSQSLQFESQRGGSALASSDGDAIEDIESETSSRYSLTLLPSEEELQQCTEDCLSPKALAANLSEDFKAENIATVRSAKAFIQLLKSFRGSGKISIAEALTSQDSYYIVPQLIDVATAAQTESSLQALFELLAFDDPDSIQHPQRFLFAAAYVSHPSESFIADLLSYLKNSIPNENLRESLLLSLGAIVNTFCQSRDRCNSPAVNDFKTLVTSSLNECKEEQCKLVYLRALGNAGLASTVSQILTYAASPDSPMVSSTAISAFRRIHDKLITSEVKEALLRIFHQNKANYESSVRIAALEFILNHQPADQDVRNILLSCLDQTNAEFSTYVVRLLLDVSSTNPSLRSQIASVLQDIKINNYNVLSQIGKSSVITSFLAQMTDLNATYRLYFENSPMGVMKQSGMEVMLQGKTIKQQFLKFGIYADGLESLVNAEEVPEGEEEANESESTIEATAGMSFVFMDVLLTQVEFFRGLSGLMSAAWNAPSELTSALQGNLLLQDHSRRVHLSNGLVLNTKVLGALSFDLSGSISISLWYRNCEALIKNSGAVYLKGSLRVESTELDIGLVFTGEGQSNIDYISNADFSSMPLKLCMQMIRPDFEFIKRVEKYVSLAKGKKYKSKSSLKSKVFGEEYLLNKANSDECRVMLTDSQ